MANIVLFINGSDCPENVGQCQMFDDSTARDLWLSDVSAIFTDYSVSYDSNIGQDVLTWTKEDTTQGYGIFFNVPENFQNWK